jgi:hypothetical protein
MPRNVKISVGSTVLSSATGTPHNLHISRKVCNVKLAMELRLPNEKLVELKHTHELFVQSKKVTLRQLQYLISRVKSCHRVGRFAGDLLMRHVI